MYNIKYISLFNNSTLPTSSSVLGSQVVFLNVVLKQKIYFLKHNYINLTEKNWQIIYYMLVVMHHTTHAYTLVVI